MKKPTLALLVLVAIGVLMIGSQQAAANHAPTTIVFVDDSDPNPDGSGCGNIANPCNMIQTGIDHANPGDTVEVAAGTYPENLDLPSSAGPQLTPKPLNLRGEQAGMDACGRAASESIVTGAGGPLQLLLELHMGSAGSTIDGFTFSGGNRAIESTSGPIDNLQILNNRIIGFTNAGVFLNNNGLNITADQNLVDGTSKTGGGGLFHLDQDNFDGFHFTNNCVVNGITGTGFFVDGNRNVDAGVFPAPTAGARPPLFHGNLIDNNLTGTNLGSRAWGGGPITENTFSRNGFDGLQGGPRDSEIARNTFDGNGRHGLALTSFGNTAMDRGAINDDILTNCFIRNGFNPAPNNGAGLFFSGTHFPLNMATNEAHDNSITGNAMGARYPAPGTDPINATLNWWGAADGPGPPDGLGSGDGVDGRGFIAFAPFLPAPAPLVPEACTPPRPALDHFKCYKAEPKNHHHGGGDDDDDDDDDDGSQPRRRVTLEDQFGSGEAYVDEATQLCNPVEKNDEGGPNQPEAHLVAYDIDPIRRKFEKRRVEVTNQFGTQTLTVKEPDTLLVPSSKSHAGEDPGEPPEQLDHFQCYPTLHDDDDDDDEHHRGGGGGGFEPRTVTLEDQFMNEEVKVIAPVAVCNPVDKNDEGIQSPEEHLTCYAIWTRAGFSKRDRQIRNQFGDEVLRVLRRNTLCVPSEKEDLGPVEDEDDDDFDDDGHRDDDDEDDDNDGHDDDFDQDDDNDGHFDSFDSNDDNDGIADSFDSESALEYQHENVGELEGGQETSYGVAADNALLLVAVVQTIAAVDELSQPLTLEIYDPSGLLVATSPAVLGQLVATTAPVLPGTYVVKVKNSGSDPIRYQTSLITRVSWPVS